MFGDSRELQTYLDSDDMEYIPEECMDPAVILALEILLGLTDEE